MSSSLRLKRRTVATRETHLIRTALEAEAEISTAAVATIEAPAAIATHTAIAITLQEALVEENLREIQRKKARKTIERILRRIVRKIQRKIIRRDTEMTAAQARKPLEV